VLFNSHAFILVFLPVTYLAFLAARRAGFGPAPTLALFACSLWFYGDWSVPFLGLLVASIAANFAIGGAMLRSPMQRRRTLLALGVAGNLALLFWFKYAGFASGVLADATGRPWSLSGVALPIGISFYTFQQIAYLVDVWRGDEVDRSPLRYAAFVTFFPHLIAGPIVHHRELTSQFPHLRQGRLLPNLAIGITVFTIGLAKKVILADTLARTASPVFDGAAAGAAPGLIAGWLAVLAYGLQIYFDFSGYSDMAIGLARMFGIHLPINFASPYRARSIVEFWRRWHITLSRFLRVYLYVPLGGNRRGAARRLVNIMLTMVLGGLWHGAGWTFVLWGALHGAMLVTAHAWRMARLVGPPAALSAPLTLLGVMLAWVPFRAADLGATGVVYGALFGGNGLGAAPPSAFDGLAAGLALRMPGLDWALLLAALPVGLALGLALLAPNTQTWMRHFSVGLPTPGYETGIEEPRRVAWSPGLRAALLTGAALAACLLLLNRPSEFIYFQF